MSKRRKPPTNQSGFFGNPPPEMPEGYYSGDKPNPNLRAFVEQHLRERPYDPATDAYDVPAFDVSIESTKATAIYNMHSYHQGKKPHDAIRQYVRHYTQPGDLVLDPFCGSGSTALASLMEGRKAVAIDRSPAATFIAKNYCAPVAVADLATDFEELKAKVKAEIEWLYETRCDRCDGKATTAYTVYSQVFECPRCLNKVALFDCVEVPSKTQAGKDKTVRVCPHCYQRGINEEISTRTQRYGSIPVLVSYKCESGCSPERDERKHNDANESKRHYFEKYDRGKLHEIESSVISHSYPRNRMMNAPEERQEWGVKWRAGTSNFRTVDELFTKRNLWALAALFDAAKQLRASDVLLFGLEAVLINLSRVQGNSNDPRFPNNILRGTYYLPQIMREYAVLPWYEGKIRNLIDGYSKLSDFYNQYGTSYISTQSATRLDNMPSNSVDYIFTDPPYGDKVQYGEMNFLWEAWLGFDTHWHDEEIIVNDVRGKTEEDWANMMRQAMAECYRVLKPGHWLSLCYHDTSEGTWALIQDIMAEVGFVVDKSDTAIFIDTEQKSYNQLTADKVTKRDLVINFRKPKPGEGTRDLTITGEEDPTTFTDKVHAVIRDYLTAHPGAGKDRVYDQVISHMVRAGQMEAHNFDALLRQVAEPAADDPARWFLRETAEAEADETEARLEQAAARSLSDFMRRWLGRHPEALGVHYSDLFEHYLYAVQQKPRRPMHDWLLDYLYKTEEGTYRLPADDEEEAAKAQARQSGANRRIRRYLAFLQQGLAVPERERPNDATLAEWIRHCKRSGLYEQGKLLYEKGGLTLERLPEELQVEVEEDYQVCVRMLGREGDKPQKARGKRKSAKVVK